MGGGTGFDSQGNWGQPDDGMFHKQGGRIGERADTPPSSPSTVHNHYWSGIQDPSGNGPKPPANPSYPSEGGSSQADMGPGGITGRGPQQLNQPAPPPSYGPMVTPNGGVPPGMPYSPVTPPSAFQGVSGGGLQPGYMQGVQDQRNQFFDSIGTTTDAPAPSYVPPTSNVPVPGWVQITPTRGDPWWYDPSGPPTANIHANAAPDYGFDNNPPPVSPAPSPAPPPVTPPPASTAPPTTSAPPAAAPIDFGNLNDPAAWMNLVRNPEQLRAWVQQGLGPNADAQLINYYVGKVQGQPGANPTEQAGSANYWLDKLRRDPVANNYHGDPSGMFAPNTDLMSQQYALISQLMSGGPITPEVIAMMNAQNQATSAVAGQDAMKQFNQNAAGRGTFQGGTAEATRQRLMDKAMQAQLVGQRSVGIQAPQTNYSALLNALSGGQGIIGANNQLGYAYNNANASLEQQFINFLAGLGQ